MYECGLISDLICIEIQLMGLNEFVQFAKITSNTFTLPSLFPSKNNNKYVCNILKIQTEIMYSVESSLRKRDRESCSLSV